jgi:hypothetical protein
VGRGKLFDLSPSPKELDPDPCGNRPSPPPSIHPPRLDLEGWWTWRRAIWALVVAAAVGVLLYSLQHMSPHYEADPNHPRNKAVVAKTRLRFMAAVPISVAIIWFVYWVQLQGGKGEPYALFGGVSVWPSEALRLLAAIWSGIFLWRARKATDANDRFIARRFCLSHKIPEIPERIRRGHLLGRWKVVDRVEVVPAPVVPGTAVIPAATPQPGQPARLMRCRMVNVQKLWNAYLMDGTWGSRMRRAFGVMLIYYLFILGIMEVFGFPSAPCRGSICRGFDWFNTYFLAVPMSMLLTFFVIDATLTNRRFIRYITLHPTKWCERAFNQCGNRGLAQEDLRDLLVVRLIAQRTVVVGEFIYFPFLILFLLLICRNSYFDDWDWPAGVVIVYLTSTLIAMISALMLRQAAEKARRETADRLRERAVFHSARGDSGKADAVKQCVAEIEAERGGAFSLLSQHPILAAIVLPSGGIGIWALLDYLATNAF